MRRFDADWESYAFNSFSGFIRAHYFFTVWRNYKLLLHGLSIQPGKLLELGSSTGQISLRLSKKYNLKPTLVDSSNIALKHAKNLYRHYNISLSIACQNILSLSLEDCFDVVHSHGLLEHFKDEEQRKAFQNHVKYTALGGWVVCWVPTPDLFYRINRWYLELTGQWIFGYEQPLSLKKLTSYFIENQLQIQKIRHFPGWIGIAGQKN